MTQTISRPATFTEVTFTHSPSLPEVLEVAGCSLLVSTYQAGQVVAIGTDGNDLALSFHQLDHAMGIAVSSELLVVGGKEQVWSLRPHPEVASSMGRVGSHDQCWLPHSSVVTGDIQCHELAWGTTDTGDPDLWIVNTLFSCLCGLDPHYSFVPRWRPPFVTALAPDDRCHLNGMALRDGRPAFVTVMARTDAPRAWRQARNSSGSVIDVVSGETVTTGLAMPHSPRLYDGRLLVLNSGIGCLEVVELETGRRETVAALPGYARGLAVHGSLAFVGLSKIRETAIFGGAPIAGFHDQLKCGVGVVDLHTGSTIATLEFTSAVEEIFDVQVVPGVRSGTFGTTPGDSGRLWLLPVDGLAPCNG